MPHTQIIAEIGECFNGDLSQAKKLIEVAKEAGCDIAKFQTLDYEEINDNDPEAEWFRKIALTPEIIKELIKYSEMVGIEILFSPENKKTAHWLHAAGQTKIKIASNTLIDEEYIDFVNKHFGTVFMSTGMASLEEVHRAVKMLSSVSDICIMHCISEYPTGPLLEKRGLVALAPENVNMKMMNILQREFPQHTIGYSDHTVGIIAPVVAVALGAAVIEKHVTLDRTKPVQSFQSGNEYLGTDHVLSVEPRELSQMTGYIREAEKMLGSGTWERSDGEKLLRDFLRGRFTDE